MTASPGLVTGRISRVCRPALGMVTRPSGCLTKFWKPPVTGTVNLSTWPATRNSTSLPPLPLPQPTSASTANSPGCLTSKSHEAQSSTRVQ